MPFDDVAFSHLAVPLGLEPMEAKSVSELPAGPGWRYEPKWDGFRCLAFRDGADVELKAKSGKALGRYFPEMVEALAELPADRFVLDGELTITVAGALSFDALQMRLHPAESRIRKLAAETPACLLMFDLLCDERGGSLLDTPLGERRKALEALADRRGASAVVRLSPGVTDRDAAARWLNDESGELDGVVAKRLDEPYRPGERAMLKIKRLRTADCVVGGFRYLADRPEVGSLLLGLYDDAGLLHHVGFTSTIANADRPALTRRLQALAAPPGFTGRAPGGPSRWSTERSGEWTPLKPELVAEVRYDHVTADRFRHGTKLLRWRPDKAPRQCTFEQLRATVAA
jgi:ATP-dependent DNA ligase